MPLKLPWIGSNNILEDDVALPVMAKTVCMQEFSVCICTRVKPSCKVPVHGTPVDSVQFSSVQFSSVLLNFST